MKPSFAGTFSVLLRGTVTHVRVRLDGKSFVPETAVDIATDLMFDIDLHPLEAAVTASVRVEAAGIF